MDDAWEPYMWGLLIDWDLCYDEEHDSAEEQHWITVDLFIVRYYSSITHI
jgi:hypothetical protein